MKRNPALQGHRCPKCRVLNDAARRPDGNASQPKLGDVSVCAHCGTVMQLTVLGWAEAPAEVLIEMAGDPRFVKANELAGRFRRIHPRPPIHFG